MHGQRELLVVHAGPVLTLTINRPERRNALSPTLLWDLAAHLAAARDDLSVRVVIIRGSGYEAFSAGYDLTAPLPPMRATLNLYDISARQEDANPLAVATDVIADFPAPVIAMIYGYCVGAGCELAASCDLRYAADTARFGMPPAKIGIIYRPAGMLRLLNLIGLARASEMFFTGRTVSAEQAKEMGLVNAVLPGAELEHHVLGLAQEIAENAPLSVRGSKLIFRKLLAYQAMSPKDEQAIQAMMDSIMSSADLQEGILAFREKRRPRFSGR